jgi:hypothetical protein
MKTFADFPPGKTTQEWYTGVWEKKEQHIKELEEEVTRLTDGFDRGWQACYEFLNPQ